MAQHTLEDDDYRGRLDLSLWKRIVRHASPYRRQIILLCTLGMFVACTDTMFPMVTGWMIDEAITQEVTARLIGLGMLYAAMIIVASYSTLVFIRQAGQLATGMAYDLRTAGFARLQELSFSYYDVRPVGWLVTRLTSDCTKISQIIPWFTLDLVWGNCLLVGIAAAMLVINVRLGLIVLCILPPLIAVSMYFQGKLLHSSRLMRKTNSQMTASFNEAIMGVRTTKALVREDRNLEEFQILTTGMFMYSMRNAIQSAIYLPLVLSLGSIGVALALWKGGLDIMGATGLTLGSLVAFMQYATLIGIPIQELARNFSNLQSAQAAAERVQGLLDTEPEIRDSDAVRAQAAAGAEHLAGMAAERIESIDFRNVTFWYKEGEQVLSDFNLRVSGGETIALVGATGGGKSTIVSLVARFYEPRAGGIFFNGIEYRNRSLNWLQSRLGVVLQTPHLFSGTVRENIRYGRLDATVEEIEAAARLVNAHSFIAEMEQGYDTEVGEGGAKLSTGQRQLISLARAVLADPQIFIMDEATSSVDTETEALIQDGIDRLMEGRISFVIAHRLSTIRSADRILVIDDGRIVEQGNHHELMRRKGRYFNLYSRQFVREHESGVAAAMNRPRPAVRPGTVPPGVAPA